MAVFGVSITKRMDWRGLPQEFSNVYHFSTGILEEMPDNDVINEVVRLEKLHFANGVTFVRGRTWGPTGRGQAASVTRLIKDLSGTGAMSNSSMYKEGAILIQWPLGRYGSRNRPQFLRKWLHTLNLHGYPVSGSEKLTAGATPLSQYINGITVLDPNIFHNGVELCTATGRKPVGPAVHYPYLEHRQLGR